MICKWQSCHRCTSTPARRSARTSWLASRGSPGLTHRVGRGLPLSSTLMRNQHTRSGHMGELVGKPDKMPTARSSGALATPGKKSHAPPVGTLGRQDLAYTNPDTTSWGNWPPEVLARLRDAGLAPTRLDVGLAGRVQVKRQPSGLYYRMRDGWYCGTDLSGRHVFVRIIAKQSMDRLDGPGTKLLPRGKWSISTRVWPLHDGKRITWSDERDPTPTTGPASVSRADTERETRSLNMPEWFKSVLIGIPEVMQRSVIDGVTYDPQPWGSAEAWGWSDHSRGCDHRDWCEHVSLAVVDDALVLVVDVKKYKQVSWSGWACRWQAKEESPATDHTAVGRGDSTTVDRF